MALKSNPWRGRAGRKQQRRIVVVIHIDDDIRVRGFPLHAAGLRQEEAVGGYSTMAN